MLNRKSPRANFHNYSGGLYFITICTLDHTRYFGNIIDDTMHLSIIGRFAEKTLSDIPIHHPYVEIPLSVVMPNHIHAIIYLPDDQRQPRTRTTLGVVIGGFKQAVTSFTRKNDLPFAWQPRYHDHIIRSPRDCSIIADYIINNVARWSLDCYHRY